MGKHTGSSNQPENTDPDQPVSRDAESPLSLAQQLLDELDEAGIRYCHWKSNEHLEAGLGGTTDLDLLVDPRQEPAVRAVLGSCGFKRLDNAPLAGYPAMEDFLGCDGRTGSLVHVHLHFRLVLGGYRLKGYEVPWEETLLDRRVKDEETGAYRTDPAFELVLLLVRYALKIRKRDYLWRVIGRPYPDDEFTTEFEWLLERTDPATVVDLARRVIGPESADAIDSIIQQSPSLLSLRSLAKAVRSELPRSRRYFGLEALIRGQLREGRLALSAVADRLGLARSYRRGMAGGGTVIAFVGPDGSGKSTMAQTVTDWLSWKVDVLFVYFGSGDGPASLVRLPLVFARQVLDKIRSVRGGSTDHGGGLEVQNVEEKPLPIRVGMALWALTLSYEKRRKLTKMRRARNRGMVVVTDRYPQNQIQGFNDGPLLADWESADSRLLRWLGRWEARPYREAERLPPDIVVKLLVDPETARERKPEMSLQALEKRVAAVESLEYPDTTVLEIDASMPLEDVERAVKRGVWEGV